MATPWARLDLSSLAPGDNITAGNTDNFFDLGYPTAGFLKAGEVVGGEIGLRPRTSGWSNVGKTLGSHTEEGRIGFKVQFESVESGITSYAELLGLRTGDTILFDVGLRNASGAREIGARNNFTYVGQANGNPMQPKEQWSVEVYWIGTAVTVYIWESSDSSGAPSYTWGASNVASVPDNIFMLPDSADGTDFIVYDVWFTDGGRLDAAPMPGTLDFISNVSTDETGSKILISGKCDGASEVSVSFNGVSVVADLDPDGYWKATGDVGLGVDVEYEVFVDGFSSRIESTRTLPSGDSMRILMGSCFDSYSSAFFSKAITRDPDLILDGGDHGYFWLTSHVNGPIAPADASAIRALKEPMLRAPAVQSLYGKVPSVCIYSDCDGAGANSDGTFIGFTSGEVQKAHRQIFAADLPLEHSFGRVIVWKRWRIIVTDELTMASDKNSSDVAGKTKLGSAQKAWFKNQIDLAKVNGEAIVWFGDGPFHPPKVTSGTANEWSRYDTERNELVAYIQSSGVDSRIIRTNGDRHALAADDGTNNPFGGWPTVNAAPFHTTANPYGMNASEGSHPPTQTNSSQQYAILELVDDGDNLTITAKGYSSTNSLPTEVLRYDMLVDFTPGPENDQSWETMYFSGQEVDSVYLGSDLIWNS